ncbi:UNVERIFIED_CONTAM: hypothetical protein FKN15_010542 [Acipenser sinensis]
MDMEVHEQNQARKLICSSLGIASKNTNQGRNEEAEEDEAEEEEVEEKEMQHVGEEEENIQQEGEKQMKGQENVIVVMNDPLVMKSMEGMCPVNTDEVGSTFTQCNVVPEKQEQTITRLYLLQVVESIANVDEEKPGTSAEIVSPLPLRQKDKHNNKTWEVARWLEGWRFVFLGGCVVQWLKKRACNQEVPGSSSLLPSQRRGGSAADA